jgi:hypothetical protein
MIYPVAILTRAPDGGFKIAGGPNATHDLPATVIGMNRTFKKQWTGDNAEEKSMHDSHQQSEEDPAG